MVIQFPKQKQRRSYPNQQANPVGLYLILVFIVMYLVSVLWVQHYGAARRTLSPSPTVASTQTQKPQ